MLSGLFGIGIFWAGVDVRSRGSVRQHTPAHWDIHIPPELHLRAGRHHCRRCTPRTVSTRSAALASNHTPLAWATRQTFVPPARRLPAAAPSLIYPCLWSFDGRRPLCALISLDHPGGDVSLVAFLDGASRQELVTRTKQQQRAKQSRAEDDWAPQYMNHTLQECHAR